MTRDIVSLLFTQFVKTADRGALDSTLAKFQKGELMFTFVQSLSGIFGKTKITCATNVFFLLELCFIQLK